MLHSCLELLAKWWRRLGMMPVCLAMFWVTYYSLFGQPAPKPPRASYTSTPDHLENMSDFLLAPSAQEQWDITQHKQECRRQHVSPLKVTVSHHLKGMRWSSAMLCHHMGCPTYVKTNHARSNCRKLCSSKDYCALPVIGEHIHIAQLGLNSSFHTSLTLSLRMLADATMLRSDVVSSNEARRAREA